MDKSRIKAPEGYRIAGSPKDRANRDGLIYDPKSEIWFPTGGQDLRVTDSEFGKDPTIAIPWDEDVRLENVHRMYRQRRNLLVFMLIVCVPFSIRIGWMLCDYFLSR